MRDRRSSARSQRDEYCNPQRESETPRKMWPVLREIVWVLNESAVYLLAGFTLAGVLHVWLSRYDRFMPLLSGRGSRSVLLAALLGAPLPLCSCSVLPAGLVLRRKGASKGATASFLISVPETDVVSIVLTWGLLGPMMAIFRPLAAIATAIITGHAINLLDRPDETRSGTPAAPEGAAPGGGTGGNLPIAQPPRRSAWREVFHFGFVEFFDDIIGSLLFGIIVGGLITALLPRIDIAGLTSNSLLTMLLMLVIGIPMYVCATSSTPIAAGLIVGGVSPGAALVFLLAGPATNLASILVLGKELGRRATVIYLVCIALVSLVMGLWLDATLASTTLALPTASLPALSAPAGPVKIGAALLLSVLSILSLRRTEALRRTLERLAARTGIRLRPTAVKMALALLGVLLYLGSGFFVVRPGERGIITRFGRITAAYLSPGLYYRWPYPCGAARIESVARIRRIEMGFRSAAADPAFNPAVPSDTTYAGESWMLTGNEDIIDIKWMLQYRVRDSRSDLLDYVYGVSDRAALLRGAGEWALRSAVGSRNIDTLLTTERETVERVARDEFLQPLLDRCRSGVEIVALRLLDVHAPPEIHYAFRDVASAMEDKMTRINQSYEYDEATQRWAEGEAARLVLAATGQATERVCDAKATATAFAARRAAYAEHAEVTRTRMWLETLERVLPTLRKYVNLTAAKLDLWMVNSQGAGPTAPFTPPAAATGAPR